MAAVELDESAEALLHLLESGAAVRRRQSGWRAGDRPIADPAVAALRRHDLAVEEAGALLLTPAGRSWRRRRADPAAGGNRLMEERSTDPSGACELRGEPRGRRPRRSVRVNAAESPLGWLKARGLVSDRQHEAGERLRGDWTRAALAPSVTMRWDAAPAAPGRRGPAEPGNSTVAQIAARRRFEAAAEAVGTGLSDILWRVVCDGSGIENAERAMGWPARAGKVVLLLALDRLADHYRLPPEPARIRRASETIR